MNDTTRQPPADAKGYQLWLDGKPAEGRVTELEARVRELEGELHTVRQQLDEALDRNVNPTASSITDGELTGKDLWQTCQLASKEQGLDYESSDEWYLLDPETTAVWNQLAIYATSRVANAIAAKCEAEREPEDASKECLRASLVTAADTITRLRKERDEARERLARTEAKQTEAEDARDAALAKSPMPDTHIAKDGHYDPAYVDRLVSERTAAQKNERVRLARIAELQAERDVILRERDNARTERDQAWDDLAKVKAERDNALLEQDKAEADLEIANAERGQAAHERDKLRAELAEAKTARARELDKAHLDRRQAENLLDEVKAERDQARDAETAEKTAKEEAWTEAKQLRERLNRIAAYVVENAGLAEAPPL